MEILVCKQCTKCICLPFNQVPISLRCSEECYNAGLLCSCRNFTVSTEVPSCLLSFYLILVNGISHDCFEGISSNLVQTATWFWGETIKFQQSVDPCGNYDNIVTQTDCADLLCRAARLNMWLKNQFFIIKSFFAEKKLLSFLVMSFRCCRTMWPSSLRIFVDRHECKIQLWCVSTYVYNCVVVILVI